MYPQKLCKHILFILKEVKFDIQCGINHFRPDQILNHLERYSLSNHYVDNKTARLCTSHLTAKCFLCKQYLHGTILTCKLCTAPFHPLCVEDKNVCPSCLVETQYISSFLSKLLPEFVKLFDFWWICTDCIDWENTATITQQHSEK